MASKAIKIIAWGLISLAALAVAVGTAGFFILRSEEARDWLLDRARAEIFAQTGARLEIKSVAGSLLNELRFEGITLSKQGRLLLAVREMEIRHNPMALFGGRLSITLWRLQGPRVNLPLDLGKGTGGIFPLALSIRRLVVEDGHLNLPEDWEPLRFAQGIGLEGSLRLNWRGPAFNLQIKKAALHLAGTKTPVDMSGRARLARGRLELTPLQLAQGPNRLELEGTVDWQRPLALEAKIKAVVSDWSLTPMAWPGPRPPAGPLSLDLGLKGTPAGCDLSGRFRLADQELKLGGRLSLEDLSGRLNLQTPGLSPHWWGISPLPAELAGALSLESNGRPWAAATQIAAELKLERLAAYGIAANQVRLKATFAQNLATVQELSAAGPWGRLTGKGQISLPAPGQPLSLAGGLQFSHLTPPQPLAPKLPPWLRKMSLQGELTFKGSPADLGLQLELGPSRIADGLEMERLSAQGTLSPDTWSLSSLTGQGPWGSLAARGAAGPAGLEMDFALNKIDLKKLGKIGQTLGLAWPDRLPELSGLLEAGGRVSGAWGRPRLELQELKAKGDWGQLSARGWAGPDNLDLGFQMTAMRLKNLYPVMRVLGLALPAQMPELSGLLEADGRVSGAWGRPRLELQELKAKGDWGQLSARGWAEPDKLDIDCQLTEVRLQDFYPLMQALGVALPPQISTAKGTLTAKGRISGAWSAPALRLENLDLRGVWGRLSVRGLADAEKSELDFDLPDGRLQGLHLVLEALGIDLPAPMAGLSGPLSVKGHLRGPWAGPRLGLKARVHGWQTATFKAGETDIALELSPLSLRPSAGRLELKVASLRLGSQGWDMIKALAQLGPKGGSLQFAANSAQLRLGLTLKSSDPWQLPLKLSLTNISIKQTGQKAWIQADPAELILGEDYMAVSGFSLSQGEQKISLEGRAEKDGRLKGRLAVGKLLLAPWLAGKRVPAQANLNARLEAEGTLQAPTFSLAGKVDGLVWRRFPPVEIVFRGGYRNGLLAFDGQALSENRVVFDLKASLGLRLGLRPFAWELIDPGVRAVALAQDFPLALLEPLAVGISGLRGSARLEFSAQGPWQDPQLKGRFELKQGAFNVDVLDQRFRGLNARLTLEGRKIAVEEIALENGGRAHIDGLIILPAPEDEGRLELNLVSQGITISLGPWGEVTTDADLALRGPFSRPSLTGALKPKAAKLLWGLAPPSDLKEVVVLNPGEQPPAFHKPGQPKVWAPGKGLEKASLDVSLDLASSLRINVGDGWLLLKGSPRVVKKPDGPLTYHNRIEITRGLILVSGKAFQVQRGMVDFADRDRPDPDLFGEASIRVGATQIFVAVSGQASNPNVQLTSQPPMSQTDILSTIIFGQPARNLSQDQSSALSAQAAALLGQAGAGEIRKIVGSELTPDVVTVHSEGQAGSSLEAGKYLSSDLYLRYRRRMTQEGGQNLGLEYRLRNWLSLESQVGDTRDTGVDVIFNLDF